MLPLPRYIRLGGHLIRVTRKKNLILDEEAFGTWDDGALQIVIDSELSSSLAWETFWHEVIEAINSATDTKLEHHVIQTFGLLIHQVFQSLGEKGQSNGLVKERSDDG